jgi:hypothetical protein
MLVVHILGWSSFLRVTKDEFDKARTAHKTIEGIANHVKREIQNKYAVIIRGIILVLGRSQEAEGVSCEGLRPGKAP